jgi:hypothetical protein
LSPSVTMSYVPKIGSCSEPFTGLPLETRTVPSGARNGGRGAPRGFSRFLTPTIFSGVPTNWGLGSVRAIGTRLPFFSEAAGSAGIGACSPTACGFTAGVSVPAAGAGLFLLTGTYSQNKNRQKNEMEQTLCHVMHLLFQITVFKLHGVRMARTLMRLAWSSPTNSSFSGSHRSVLPKSSAMFPK